MTRAEYVRHFWPVALETGLYYGINPVAIIAHALKEAGPNNANAARRHNYFGFLKSASPRRFHEYPDDRAGYAAYAQRLVKAFPAVVAASGSADGFARAVAYHKSPDYLHESAAGRAAYAQSLASIYRGVAADVARLRLPSGMLTDRDTPAPLPARPVKLTLPSIV